QIEEIVKAVRYHMQFKDAMEMRTSTLRRLLLRPTFPLELALHRLDCLGSHGRLDVYHFLLEQAKQLENQPRIRPPLLKGDDLIADSPDQPKSEPAWSNVTTSSKSASKPPPKPKRTDPP